MKFSRFTMGFYDPDIHGADIPADAVDISAQLHNDLLEAQARGLRLAADDTGSPVAVPYDPPSDEQIAEIMRAERARRLQIEVDALAGNVLRWAEFSEAQRLAIAAHRRALLDVTTQEGWPRSVVWPVLVLDEGVA